jgi:hypothetical protein
MSARAEAPTGSGFRQALEFHGGQLGRAGQAWGRLAALVRRRAEAMLAPLHAAERSWDGRAARAALPQVRQLCCLLDTAVLPLRGHEEVLGGIAHAGDRLRQRAWDLVARAAAAGVSVDHDGRVRPAGVPDEFAARAVDSYRREVAEVAAEAARLDRQAVRELAHHAPWRPGRALGMVRVEEVPRTGTSPDAVHRWWDGLTAAQQRYLVTLRPELVGGLDGVPVAARDAANRALLERERQRLRDRIGELDQSQRYLDGELTPDPSAHMPGSRRVRLADERRAADTALAALAAVERWLSRPVPGRQRAYLLDVSTGGDGRVVLALGNPDRADNVITYVPGAGATLRGAGGYLSRAETMARDADRLDGPDRTAVVYWLGYDAPDWRVDLNNPASARAAVTAAVGLRTFAEGLRATHAGGGSQNTFLGHSYGSTVVGRAAVAGLAADRLIFLGSPGVVADHVTELDIDADPTRHVWAARADDDVIRHVPDGLHGPDPSGPTFGAQVFAAGPDGGHSGYWAADDPAREAMALIAIGRYEQARR